MKKSKNIKETNVFTENRLSISVGTRGSKNSLGKFQTIKISLEGSRRNRAP